MYLSPIFRLSSSHLQTEIVKFCHEKMPMFIDTLKFFWIQERVKIRSHVQVSVINITSSTTTTTNINNYTSNNITTAIPTNNNSNNNSESKNELRDR